MEPKWLRYKCERRFDAFVWDACTWTTCDIKLDVDNTKSYVVPTYVGTDIYYSVYYFGHMLLYVYLYIYQFACVLLLLSSRIFPSNLTVADRKSVV